MKILLSVAVWGSDYVSTFANFSIASQLSPNNIPKLSAEHDVTYHIVTTAETADALRDHPTIVQLKQYCTIIWELIEDHGYNPRHIPRGFDGGKYPFLSRLQNISIARSIDYEILIFNYADFVWADGSLVNTIQLMRGDVGAVLSFCLPVDRRQGQQALARYHRRRSRVVDLPPRAAAAIAIDHMHRETKLRYWDGPHFTKTPTYLLWPVTDEGLVIRAYHQTVLALRVQRQMPEYAAGIRYGSLDGYFTAVLADKMSVASATDSDRVMVFSLYDANTDSSLEKDKTRESAMQECLRTAVSEVQRRLAKIPIYVKRAYNDHDEWERIVSQSWDTLERIHRIIPADLQAFEDFNAQRESMSFYEEHWRAPTLTTSFVSWLYVRLYVRGFAKLVASPLGTMIKRMLGHDRARSIRLAIEGWLFGRGG